MGLEARIGGASQLRQVAAQIRATGDRGLGQQMSRALAKATNPVREEIRVSAADTMPSGYQETLTKSLRFRTSVRAAARQASVRLITTGAGKAERRDVRALEKGDLRHPVFRRSRRITRGVRAGSIQLNPWTITKIRAGFHERGTDKAADAAERELTKVLDDFASRLLKG